MIPSNFKTGLLTCFFLLLFLPACSHNLKDTAASADEQYARAMKYYNKKNYLDAATEFEKVRANFPFSKYAIDAELKIADCAYYDGKYAEAETAYREFIKIHPTNSDLPHAWYYQALCHYKDAVSISIYTSMVHFFQPDSESLSIDKDVSDISKAAGVFQEFLSLFPKHEFAADARKKLQTCQKNLFAHDLYVGQYYLKFHDYYSAYLRFEKIEVTYPDSPRLDEIAFLKGNTLLLLNERDMAATTFTGLITRYPQSKYLAAAKSQLTLLQESRPNHG